MARLQLALMLFELAGSASAGTSGSASEAAAAPTCATKLGGPGTCLRSMGYQYDAEITDPAACCAACSLAAPECVAFEVRASGRAGGPPSCILKNSSEANTPFPSDEGLHWLRLHGPSASARAGACPSASTSHTRPAAAAPRSGDQRHVPRRRRAAARRDDLRLGALAGPPRPALFSRLGLW